MMKRNANLSDGCIHGEIFSKSHQIKPKSDWIYHFLIDLDPIGRPFGSKINRKMLNTIQFPVDLRRYRKYLSVYIIIHRIIPDPCRNSKADIMYIYIEYFGNPFYPAMISINKY